MYIGVDTRGHAHALSPSMRGARLQRSRSGEHARRVGRSAAVGARPRRRTYLGIEDTGSLGKRSGQFPLDSGEATRSTTSSRTAQYRKRGRRRDKTDHTDALAMAAYRRDNLVAARMRLVNRLHAQMLQIDPCDAERSGALMSRYGSQPCVAPAASARRMSRSMPAHSPSGWRRNHAQPPVRCSVAVPRSPVPPTRMVRWRSPPKMYPQ
jgi:hypothetical protein